MTKWLQCVVVATTLVSLSPAFVSPDNDPTVAQRARIIQRFAVSHNLRGEAGLSPVLSHQSLIPMIWSSFEVLPVLYFAGKLQQNSIFFPVSAIGLDVRPGRAPPTLLPA